MVCRVCWKGAPTVVRGRLVPGPIISYAELNGEGENPFHHVKPWTAHARPWVIDYDGDGMT